MEIKAIKNHRILPLLYKKQFSKSAFTITMFGAIVSLIFLIKLAYSYYSNNTKFTENDLVGLGASLFLFGMFMPITLILYVSHTLLGIIESIVDDNETEQKPLTENI